VTTRAKGTGLGLAIVRKILEDHSGELLLEDDEMHSGETWSGAVVSLVFPQRRSGKVEGVVNESERVAGLV
jgi:two-component system nitrogen regulation sensor histidine kinase NtrY